MAKVVDAARSVDGRSPRGKDDGERKSPAPAADEYRGAIGDADAVVVISEWFRTRLLEKGVNSEKIWVIPNFVDTDFVRPRARRNGVAWRHELVDRFVVLYAGSFGLTQDFEAVLDAAERLAAFEDIRFVIVGDGARRAGLERDIARRAPRYVVLLPYQAHSVIPDLYATSDVGLIPLKQGGARDTVPSKVYTIMASARPVLAAVEPDTEMAWLVREAACGMVVPPECPEALARAIVARHTDRSRCRALGERGREYVVASHSRRAGCQRYDALLRELTGHD
jgi:colanic acid biosynthesis glycosyl transferase WcaI